MSGAHKHTGALIRLLVSSHITSSQVILSSFLPHVKNRFVYDNISKEPKAKDLEDSSRTQQISPTPTYFLFSFSGMVSTGDRTRTLAREAGHSQGCDCRVWLRFDITPEKGAMRPLWAPARS